MTRRSSIPREVGLDHTKDVLREGYQYIPNRKKAFQSDFFESRILGEKTVFMSGEEAAELFYDTDKFKREGAAPKRVQKTLLGEHGVQGLDGPIHRHRKEMLMSLMSEERLQALDQTIETYLEQYIDKWEKKKSIQLYDEAVEMIFQIACDWAGIPLEQHEIRNLAPKTADLFESPATIGVKQFKARNSRIQLENWAKDLIMKTREKEIHPPEETALYVIAWHRDLEGKLEDIEAVADDLLNIIRPMVAISIYVTFTAHAVIHHPKEVEKLRAHDDRDAYKRFIQEVRRFYPFFPFNVARVKEDFVYRGHAFKENDQVIFDFHGTNNDPKIWNNPDLFTPDRFKDWDGSPFNFVPQGGGDYLGGHRCAGEWITIRMMQIFLHYFVEKIDFEVPPQDMSYSLVHPPTMPKSKIVMKNVRWKA